jgi:hypothetical protein
MQERLCFIEGHDWARPQDLVLILKDESTVMPSLACRIDFAWLQARSGARPQDVVLIPKGESTVMPSLACRKDFADSLIERREGITSVSFVFGRLDSKHRVAKLGMQDRLCLIAGEEWGTSARCGL